MRRYPMSRRTLWPMLSTLIVLVVLLLSALPLLHSPQTSSAAPANRNSVSVWLTTADLQKHLDQQSDVSLSPGNATGVITITVDQSKAYQQMVGFGASLTDGSAWLISHKMSQGQRNDLMIKLFDPVRGIGLNFLRQPMGASDLTLAA